MSVCFLSACAPDDPEKENPSGETGEKKELLFEVDEGVGGYDFIAGYGYDKNKLDEVLQNACDAVDDLTEKYDVSLLIFPQWYYDEDGWADSEETGVLRTLSPDFLYGMEYFEERGIGVYIEIMASGIYCSSNGELGYLPLVNINHNTDEPRREVKGLGMDLSTLAALKERFPETMRGVVVHELIGTHHLGMANDPHGFKVYEEDVIAIIDACAESDLKLVWEDWDWDSAFDNSADSFWLTLGKHAEEKLGKDCIFIIANNSIGTMRYLADFRPMIRLQEYFPNSEVGLSNQDWFSTIINFYTGFQSEVGAVVEPEYPECDVPVEVAAGFTLRAFELGASMVQYEAPYQFFNTYRSLYLTADLGIQNPKKMEGYVGDTTGYDKAPDYSARVEMKRLTELLLAGDDTFNDIQAFYDADLAKLTENLETNAPQLYAQSTLIGYGEGQDSFFYDKYSNDRTAWREDSENRLGDWFFNENTVRAQRIAMTRNDHDGVVTMTRENGKNVGYVHNARSCLVFRDETMFADNADGKFVSFTTANIIPEVVANCDMDPDEIIVAREKDGEIHFSIYKFRNTGTYRSRMPNLYKTGVSKVDNSVAEVYLLNLFGTTSVPAAQFVDVVGIRTRNGMNLDSTRPVEGALIALKNGSMLTLFGKRSLDDRSFAAEINVSGTLNCLTAGDTDLDPYIDDEIVLQVTKNGKTHLEFYEFEGHDTLIRLESTIDLGEYSSSQLFNMKKSTYQWTQAR